MVGFGALILLLVISTAHAQTSPQALAMALKDGGLVVVLQHPSALDQGARWPSPTEARSSNCTQQSLLSSSGRREAGFIGRAFRALGFPVGRILASPHCRARHAAYLAFGADRVRHDALLASGCPGQGEDATALNALLAESPQAGTNTVLFTHGCTLEAVAGNALARCGMLLGPGGALVVRPGAGDWRPLGCIPLTQWRQWSQRPYPAPRSAPPTMG